MFDMKSSYKLVVSSIIQKKSDKKKAFRLLLVRLLKQDQLDAIEFSLAPMKEYSVNKLREASGIQALQQVGYINNAWDAFDERKKDRLTDEYIIEKNTREKDCGEVVKEIIGRFVGRGNDGHGSVNHHCDGCGSAHGKNDCPAYGNECGFCAVIGHFERCCFLKSQAREKARDETVNQQNSSYRKKKQVHADEEGEEEEDDERLSRSAKKKRNNERSVNFLARNFNADEYESRDDWLSEEPYRMRRSRWYE